MKRQAEIKLFAVFLFCSLVSLSSTAPTATPEDKEHTAGQRQEHFTTRIMSSASEIERQATTLFKNYNACSSITPRTANWLSADSQVNTMVKKIPECPAFATDCCAFHAFHNILRLLKSDVASICGDNLTQFVDANINQLKVTLMERAALYTCDEELPLADRSEIQQMSTGQKRMYLWQVLQKYEQFMQDTTQTYSSAEVQRARSERSP